jgi:hypothetical protein
MAGRQSPAVIKHPSGLKKRCASNRRYAIVRVSSYVQKWNAAQGDYDRFSEPQHELVVERRTDNLRTAQEFLSDISVRCQPLIWDLARGEIVASRGL